LGHDEIVFDEVRYREPARSRRPDRDRRWACVAYEVPGPEDLPIFLDLAAADAIERHALRDTSVELGGILLGKECVDDKTGEPFVWVTQALEAKHYENTQASFTYTHESWEEITRERDRQFPDLDIVGWYHTHPDFGVFLSHHDLFIQRHFFGQPLQVAYVVDPVRQTRGFFRWRDGEMEPTGGFYLSAERDQRLALARLANDLENLPGADPAGGLGALSPRLEAELIAMLSRPSTHAHASVAVDRPQTLMLAAMLGAMLGVLGLSAVLWLNALYGQMAEQARAIEGLRKTVSDTADRQIVTLDAALDKAGQADPSRFIERYATAARARDEAIQKLDNQLAANDLLLTQKKQSATELADLRKKYEAITIHVKDAREAVDLRAQLAELRDKNDAKTRTIEELEDLLNTAAGQKATRLLVSYQKTWYWAVAGWAVSAVLALALVGGYVYLRGSPFDDDLPAPEEPPHQIT
jgi:proteasome lid subunit RPN8/RPN11